jgi:hypothetical protein
MAATTGTGTATATVATATASSIPSVPRVSRLLFRRSTIGLAWSAYRLWRRIPPAQRRKLIQQGRKHGPTIARKAMQARKRPRK